MLQYDDGHDEQRHRRLRVADDDITLYTSSLLVNRQGTWPEAQSQRCV